MKRNVKFIVTLVGAMLLSGTVIGCGFFDDVVIDDDYDYDVDYDSDDDTDDDSESDNDSRSGKDNGDYSDLYADVDSFSYDSEAGDVWEEYEESPDEVIGLWFEDGNLDGYSMTVSGNGSWVQHGESILTGYYEVESSVVYLYTDDGTDVGMLTTWGDGCNMTMDCVNRDIMDFHLDPTTLTRDTESTAQGSMQDYYDTFFEYEFMMGTWYPEGDSSSDVYFTVDETGQWSRYFNYKENVEYGYLQDNGDGYYSSTEINWGGEYEFYYPGDGSLWINDEQYFQAD